MLRPGLGGPVFDDLGQGADHLGDLVRRLRREMAILARLQEGVRGARQALDHAGDVLRELLGILDDKVDRAAVDALFCGAGFIVGHRFPERSMSSGKLRCFPERAECNNFTRRAK
jgi:hypothetical protein